LKQKFEKL